VGQGRHHHQEMVGSVFPRALSRMGNYTGGRGGFKLRALSKNTHYFDLNEISGLIENVIRKGPSMCPSGDF